MSEEGRGLEDFTHVFLNDSLCRILLNKSLILSELSICQVEKYPDVFGQDELASVCESRRLRCQQLEGAC